MPTIRERAERIVLEFGLPADMKSGRANKSTIAHRDAIEAAIRDAVADERAALRKIVGPTYGHVEPAQLIERQRILTALDAREQEPRAVGEASRG